MTLVFPKKFNAMASMTQREASITKEVLFHLSNDEGEYLPLKPILSRVTHALDEDMDDVIVHRRKMGSKYGLVESRRKKKTDGAIEGVWLTRLTDLGNEFFEWLSDTEEALAWGTEDHPPVARTAVENADWHFGELGFIVEDRIPYGIWKEINKEIKAKGYRTVIVPPEGKVYLGVVKDGKNKAVPIPTWAKLQQELSSGSEETEDERIERLKRELEEAMQGKSEGL